MTTEKTPSAYTSLLSCISCWWYRCCRVYMFCEGWQAWLGAREGEKDFDWRALRVFAGLIGYEFQKAKSCEGRVWSWAIKLSWVSWGVYTSLTWKAKPSRAREREREKEKKKKGFEKTLLIQSFPFFPFPFPAAAGWHLCLSTDVRTLLSRLSCVMKINCRGPSFLWLGLAWLGLIWLGLDKDRKLYLLFISLENHKTKNKTTPPSQKKTGNRNQRSV